MPSNTAIVMTLANSIIGVGVLAMPFCFKQCGILLSIMMLILSSGLSRLACHFLLKAAIMARRRNFEFLAFHTFGTHGKTIVEVFIIGFLMGTCIAFFVVMGDLGPVIVAKLFNLNNTPGLRRMVLIGVAVGIVLPLGMMRNVASLSAICTATIGFYLVLVLKVMAESRQHLTAHDWLDEVYLWRPAGLLQCTPIFSMALFCQTQLFEIYETLPNATLEKMDNVVRYAVNLCTAFYILVGFFGYVAFCNQNFTGNILLSFSENLASDVIKMGFVLSVAVSFPLVIFPCRASLYSLLFKRNIPCELPFPSRTQNSIESNFISDVKSDEMSDFISPPGQRTSDSQVTMPHHETSMHIPETRFKYLTVSIITVALIVGVLVPNIETVLGYVASTIGVSICVIFPAIVFIRISKKDSKERLLAQVLIFVGLLISAMGLYANLIATNSESAVTYPPDRIDSIARMSLSPANRNFVAPVESNVIKSEDESPPKVEPVKDSPAVGQNLPQLKEAELPKVAEVEKKLDVRKEPPVPVEPPGDIPAAKPSGAPETLKQELPPPAVEKSNQVEEPANSLLDDKKEKSEPHVIEEKNHPSPAKKEKVISDQVNQDAIKREEEELAEAEKQAKNEEEKKDAELLKKLKKHQEEQKKLLQEQKQILEELKEHKKEIDEAAAKKKADDVPQLPGAAGDKVAAENKINISDVPRVGLPSMVDRKLSEINNSIQNSGNLNKIKNDDKINNEINKPIMTGTLEEKKSLPMKSDFEKKLEVPKEEYENVKKFKKPDLGIAGDLITQKILSHRANKMGNDEVKSVGDTLVQKQGLGEQPQPIPQDGLAPLHKKLPLPLPLAVRNLTSQYYKQQQQNLSKLKVPVGGSEIENQQDVKPPNAGNEAKVMRREILADNNIGLTSNASQEVAKPNPQVEEGSKTNQKDINDKTYEDTKNEIHDRMKRDVTLEESVFEKVDLFGDKVVADKKGKDTLSVQETKNDGDCDIHDKDNKIKDADTQVMCGSIPCNHKNPIKDPSSSDTQSKDSSVVEVDSGKTQTEKILPNPTQTINVPMSKSSLDHSSLSRVDSAVDSKVVEGSVPGHDSNVEAKSFKNIDAVTLSSLIKTPSHLSNPVIKEINVQHLSEAAANINDVSVVPKPMARDLKSISPVSTTQDEDEHKEKKTTDLFPPFSWPSSAGLDFWVLCCHLVEKSAVATHYWKEGHKINNEAKLLKHIGKHTELTVWKKLFIQKNKEIVMNFDIPVEDSLTTRFIHPPPDGNTTPRSRVQLTMAVRMAETDLS